MDAELKSKWTVALRGGGYKQANGYLRVGETFCCLGVACDLLDPKKWSGVDDTYSYGDGICVWPAEVQKTYGLTSRQSKVLWEMNDAGKSFAEIADYIEASL